MLLIPFLFPGVSPLLVGLFLVLVLLIRWLLACVGGSCIVGYAWHAGSLGVAGLGLSIAAPIGDLVGSTFF